MFREDVLYQFSFSRLWRLASGGAGGLRMTRRTRLGVQAVGQVLSVFVKAGL